MQSILKAERLKRARRTVSPNSSAICSGSSRSSQPVSRVACRVFSGGGALLDFRQHLLQPSARIVRRAASWDAARSREAVLRQLATAASAHSVDSGASAAACASGASRFAAREHCADDHADRPTVRRPAMVISIGSRQRLFGCRNRRHCARHDLAAAALRPCGAELPAASALCSAAGAGALAAGFASTSDPASAPPAAGAIVVASPGERRLGCQSRGGGLARMQARAGSARRPGVGLGGCLRSRKFRARVASERGAAGFVARRRGAGFSAGAASSAGAACARLSLCIALRYQQLRPLPRSRR